MLHGVFRVDFAGASEDISEILGGYKGFQFSSFGVLVGVKIAFQGVSMHF